MISLSSLTWGKDLKARFPPAEQNGVFHLPSPGGLRARGPEERCWSQIFQSCRCQHLPLRTMVLAGCWELLKVWHRHIKDCCITLFKPRTSKSLTWHRLCISFQNLCIFTEQTHISSHMSTNPVTRSRRHLSGTPTPARRFPGEGVNLARSQPRSMRLPSLAEGKCWTRVLRRWASLTHAFPVTTWTESSCFPRVLSRPFTGAKF